MKTPQMRAFLTAAATIVGILVSATHPAYAWSDCAEKAVIPTDLTAGTFRSAEFSVKRTGYWIVLLLDSKNFSPQELDCALGTEFLHPTCAQDSPLKGTWTVWEGATQVATGTFAKTGHGEMLGERILGEFQSAAKKKYRVEVTFAADGGRLKTMKPRLIVRQWYDFWCSPM